MSRAKLTAISFNAWVGQQDRVRGNLMQLVKDTDHPPILALQEVPWWDGSIPDYRRVAADALRKRRDGQRGYPEAASNTMLVRDDVEIYRRWVIPVSGPDWFGARHDRWHRPRIFTGVTVGHGGSRWDLLDIHRTVRGFGVNRDAYRAEDRELVAWVHRRMRMHPTRPIALMGDWNSRMIDPRRTAVRDLANRLDAEAMLIGIDGALAINANVSGRKLKGKYGSDGHHPVLMTLTREAA